MRYSVVTGAAGFIGSCLISRLNEEGITGIIAVDDFTNPLKNKNLEGKTIAQKIDREVFPDWFAENASQVEAVYHIGARTDTAEFDTAIFEKLNVGYSKKMWALCTQHQIPLIYASSAATYGNGEWGYDDSLEIIDKLKPLNPYGESKNEFDKWVLKQETAPPFWAGLKFFNVYGPNEYHKSRMASVIFHAFYKIQATGKMELFRSHRPDFEDGMQLRDFVYVKDLVEVMVFLMKTRLHSSIYNLGTGTARSFLNLTQATFSALRKAENISFIDIPEDIRDKYQYYTQANMTKLREKANYTQPFFSLEEGVTDYVQNYLVPGKYY